MGIFNEFFKKEKPFFTGIGRGFGFGGAAGTGAAAARTLEIEFVLFGAGGSTSRPAPGNGGSGKGGRTLATYRIPSAATLEFRAGGRGQLQPGGNSHGGAGGGSSSVHIGSKSGISNALLYAGGGGGSGDNIPPTTFPVLGRGNNTAYSSSNSGGVSAGQPGVRGGQPEPSAGQGSPGSAGGAGGTGTDPAPGPGVTGGAGEDGGAHRGGFGGPIQGSYYPPGKASQSAENPADAPVMDNIGEGNAGGWPDGGWGGGRAGVVEGGGGGGGGYYGGGGGGVAGNAGSGGGGGSGFAASTGTINGIPVVFVSTNMGVSQAGESRTTRDADPSGTAPAGVQVGVPDSGAPSTLGGFGWIAYRVDGGSWNSIPGENNTPSGSNQEVTVPLAPFA